MTSLRILSLSANQLRSFPVIRPAWPNVSNLTLDNNDFEGLESLPDIVQSFPNLSGISLQGNNIKWDAPSQDQRRMQVQFPALEELNLSRNRIQEYSSVDALTRLCPNLKVLQISHNPFLYSTRQQEEEKQRSAMEPDVSFYLTLARIPTLQSLNYTSITSRDREEGEIYYVSIAEKEIRHILESTKTFDEAKMTCEAKYPRYEALCQKYDREDLLEKYVENQSGSMSSADVLTQKINYPAGSLAARMVHAYFYMLKSNKPKDEATPHFWDRRLPRNIDAYTLKSVVATNFQLPPGLKFRLIYESPELDPVKEEIGDPKDWESWGDWDVDELGDELARQKERQSADAEQIIAQKELSSDQEGRWEDGILLKDGVRWKRREFEILGSWKEWGAWLENDATEVKIRVEQY